MPSTSEFVLAAIAVLAVVAFALLLAPAFVWARRRFDEREQAKEVGAEGPVESTALSTDVATRQPAPATFDNAAGSGRSEPSPAVQDPTLEDRVVRVVSWAFLMAVAVFAAASGVWPDALSSIVILIAITGQILLILQDVLPRTPLHRARGPLQGVLALVFASSLVALTGGLESPFTFT